MYFRFLKAYTDCSLVELLRADIFFIIMSSKYVVFLPQ